MVATRVVQGARGSSEAEAATGVLLYDARRRSDRRVKVSREILYIFREGSHGLGEKVPEMCAVCES